MQDLSRKCLQLSKCLFHSLLVGLCLIAVLGLSRVALAQNNTALPSSTPSDTTKQDPVLIPVAKPDDPEVRLGRDNADEHDKQVKLLTDPVLLDRVRRIGNEIASVANKATIPAYWGHAQMKQFQYVFKIVDDKDVNAYCMPGGFVYVCKGLLDKVNSDDELAGVLAHEISHAAHHHVLKLLKEQSKIQRATLPLQLLSLLMIFVGRGAASGDAINIYTATNLYEVAKTNTYGVEAEKDADQTGIRLLMQTRYNPVGLYSFMIRLAALERRSLAFELGIYRTHPPGEQRVEAAKKLMQELNIPLLLSQVDPTLRATIAPVQKQENTVPQLEIQIMGLKVCRVVGTEDSPPDARAERIAKRLDYLFDTNISPLEIALTRDRTKVVARGQALFVTEDAEGQGLTMEDLLRNFKEAVVAVHQKRRIEFYR